MNDIFNKVDVQYPEKLHERYNDLPFSPERMNNGKSRNRKRRNYLVSEPNYHTTKTFTENFLATEMRKTQILMNKPVFWGLSELDLGKTVIMYEFWYDFIKPKYGQNTNICYKDTDSFIVHVKVDDDVYKDIAKDIETRFDTLN